MSEKNKKNNNRLTFDLQMPQVTAQMVVEAERQRNEIMQRMSKHEVTFELARDSNEKAAAEQEMQKIQRELADHDLEFGYLHDDYVRQDKILYNKEELPEYNTWIGLKNEVAKLERENELIMYNITHGGKLDYTQRDQNEARIRELKREVDKAEIAYSDKKEALQNTAMLLEITPARNEKYSMVVALNGEYQITELSQQDMDKFRALDDSHKIMMLKKLTGDIPWNAAADKNLSGKKGVSDITQYDYMTEALKKALYQNNQQDNSITRSVPTEERRNLAQIAAFQYNSLANDELNEERSERRGIGY